MILAAFATNTNAVCDSRRHADAPQVVNAEGA